MDSKFLIVLMLLLVLFSLGKALFHLWHGSGDRKAVVKSLTWRIGLSVGLFVLLILAYALGWIHPNR